MRYFSQSTKCFYFHPLITNIRLYRRNIQVHLDFDITGVSILIGNGVTSIILPLVVIDDNIPEFGEVFILRLIRVRIVRSFLMEAAAIMSPVLGYNTIAEIYIPQNDGPQGILQFSLGSLHVEESIGTFSVPVERVVALLYRLVVVWSSQESRVVSLLQPGILIMYSSQWHSPG